MDSAFEKELRATTERLFASPRLPTPPRLKKSILYSLLSPGKRIRPRLCLATAQMIGLPLAQARPAAIAIEMIHCFSLIHDDLPCMDNDDFRRGRPSNHKKFDEGTALLAGDALCWMALDALLTSPAQIKPTRLLSALKRLSDATGTRGMIGGQAAESDLDRRPGLKNLLKMHAAKTGALFEASILMPADLKGLLPIHPRFKRLKSLSLDLGAAFQALDDIEDGVQDRHDSKNILYYASSSKILKASDRALSKSLAAVQRDWKSTQLPVTLIVTEVLNRLREQLGRSS